MNSVTVSWFGPLLSEVKQIKESHVSKNTLKNTSWAQQVWQQRATEWLQNGFRKIRSDFVLEVDIRTINDKAINHWLQRFVLEARKTNGEHHSPDILHQICCGLQRAIRAACNTDVNLFMANYLHLFVS